MDKLLQGFTSPDNFSSNDISPYSQQIGSQNTGSLSSPQNLINAIGKQTLKVAEKHKIQSQTLARNAFAQAIGQQPGKPKTNQRETKRKENDFSFGQSSSPAARNHMLTKHNPSVGNAQSANQQGIHNLINTVGKQALKVAEKHKIKADQIAKNAFAQALGVQKPESSLNKQQNNCQITKSLPTATQQKNCGRNPFGSRKPIQNTRQPNPQDAQNLMHLIADRAKKVAKKHKINSNQVAKNAFAQAMGFSSSQTPKGTSQSFSQPQENDPDVDLWGDCSEWNQDGNENDWDWGWDTETDYSYQPAEQTQARAPSYFGEEINHSIF